MHVCLIGTRTAIKSHPTPLNPSHPTPSWFTCTPVDFGGGPDFFARDSGLLCRGFRSLGIESRAVMPGPPKPDDEPDLIRTDDKNLESPEWWKSQHLDGVVLYAWGRPKFRNVARAIRKAGIFLVLNQDNGGLVSPLAGPADWWKEQWTLAGGSRTGFLRLVIRGLTLGLFVTDPLRAIHLHQGDILACVSPQAAEIHRDLCRFYGGTLADRIRVIPHPVEPSFTYDGEKKRRRILCVGRWDDAIQKRPGILTEVVDLVLERDSDACFIIAGNATAEMRAWHESLGPSRRDRVDLTGMLDRRALAAAMRESQVFYSPSAYESFGIAAAEALCCGCSVAAGKSISMASFAWFVTDNSGSLADVDTPDAHAATLLDELDHWQTGRRDARQIASTWQPRLHADRVASRILTLHAQALSSARS